MSFSTPVFLFLFLPIALLGYYWIRTELRNLFLLLMSLFFYAWGEPKFVFVMIGSILVNHFIALMIDVNLQKKELITCGDSNSFKKKAKIWLCLMVVFNLSLFFVYKYLDFSILNINRVISLFGQQPLPLQNIALPIGISFFTFQTMSYVFDVYYRRAKVQKNPLNTALYISLFPQLVAGPIVRYETIAQELLSRKTTVSDFSQGIKRFIIGLSKKVILADSLAIIADLAFNGTQPSELTVALAWLGAIAYTLQIYYDFSGYSDMAIGLGLMFGFHFNENFNYPYISKTISEFWRRWHISLGSWFRDYVYIPLGGSRVEKRSRHIFNLFVVWFLTGMWHGAAWHYIAWGMLSFVIIVFEKVANIPQRFKSTIIGGGYQMFTILAIIFGWVLFRANGLGHAAEYMGSMVGLMENKLFSAGDVYLLRSNLVILLTAAVCCFPILSYAQEKIKRYVHVIVSDLITAVCYAALFILSIAFMIGSTYQAFIYFKF